jgi:hypothetical protein
VIQLPSDVQLAEDVGAAEWLRTALWPWPTPEGHVLVGSIVPEGFESHAAVRHAHPERFELTAAQCRALAGFLAGFTAGADLCWFCVWTGFGGLDLRATDDATLRIPDREYLLLRGPLASVHAFDPLPQIWWPGDRAWCVAGDIDLARTFVGGSEACIEALSHSTELDAEPVPLETRVDGTNELERLTSRD